MIHHFVFAYVDDRPSFDLCKKNRPVAAGSELTDVSLPAGYGYQIRPGGALTGANWHWVNHFNVPHHEEVYLRFILLFDDEAKYRDTHATWVTAFPCSEEFAIPPGSSEKEGPPLTAPDKMRVVAVCATYP